jgi:AcrR family transcriptional regulator
MKRNRPAVKAGGVEQHREDGRRTRWAEHRAVRRAQMVEAAVSAIRRQGPGVGMDDIAAEAGVSKPILYRNFTDKTDLYLAVGRWGADRLVAQIAAELDHPRAPRDHLAAVIDVYLAFIEADPDLYRFVVQHRLADRPIEHDPVADYSATVAAHLSRVLGERLRGLGLDSGGAEAWGHGLVGLVQAAGDWWLERKSMPRAALTEYLTTLVWGGFVGMFAAAGVAPDGPGLWAVSGDA